MKNLFRGIGGVIATAVVLVLCAGIYLGGWRLRTDVSNRRAHLNRTAFEQQTTYRDEMVRKIEDVKAIDVQLALVPAEGTTLQAQRRAIVNIVCRDNTHINGGLDGATDTFVKENC